MKINNYYLVLIFLLLLQPAFPGYAVTGTTNDPLLIGGGARPLGMGRAFVAIVDDSDAPLINPAGIATIKSPQLLTMFTNLLGEVYYAEITGAVPSANGTFAAAYVTTGVNHVLTPIDSTLVYTDYYDNTLILSYSSPLARFFDYGRNLWFGANLKTFSRGFTGGTYATASGWSADFGLKLVVNPYFSLGFNRQNLVPVNLGNVIKWSTGAEDAIAGIYKFGAAIRPKPFARRLLLALDLDLPAQSGRPTTMHAGGEYQINNNFIVRSGLDQSVDAASPNSASWNPTAGISVALGGFRLDYTFHDYTNDPSLATSYVSLSVQAEPGRVLEGGAD